jgi:TonB family protein
MGKSQLFIIALFIVGFILLGAFGLMVTKGCQQSEETSTSSAEEIPKKVRGLKVQGPRTEANVIANMAPVIRSMQNIYQEHLERNQSLSGKIKLRITVEWTGDVGLIEIADSSLSDPEFERAVLLPIQSFDFDGWSESDEDTEILYPIAFG